MLSDLTAFVQDHQRHGQLVGDASEPGPSGYLVTVACPCGVVFERWAGWLAPVERVQLRDLSADRKGENKWTA